MEWQGNELPIEVILQIMKHDSIQNFLTFSRLNKRLREIGREHQGSILQAILGRAVSKEVLPVALWCSKARRISIITSIPDDALSAESFAEEMGRLVSWPPRHPRHEIDDTLLPAESYVGEIRRYLNELPRSPHHDIDVADALWILNLSGSISTFCHTWLSQAMGRCLARDCDRIPAFLHHWNEPPRADELARAECAGFMAAAMIEGCAPGPRFSSVLVRTWEAIPSLLSEPELRQVKGFFSQFSDHLARCFQSIREPESPRLGMMHSPTGMGFGADFVFAKIYGLRAALDLSGSPAADPRYSDFCKPDHGGQLTISIPHELKHVFVGAVDFRGWFRCPPAPGQPLFAYPSWAGHLEAIQWYRDDPHSDILFNYFCLDTFRSLDDSDGMGSGYWSVAIWSPERVNEVLRWRISEYAQPAWHGREEERYAKNLRDWIRERGMSEEGVGEFELNWSAHPNI